MADVFLLLGKSNGVVPETLPIYSRSLTTTVVTTFP